MASSARWNGGAAVFILLFFGGCETSPGNIGRGKPPAAVSRPIDEDQVTQISIINALLLSRYDGVMPVGELLEFGDFGLGTFDHLDGEMIVLDGVVWQAKADGAVVAVDAATTTPFAVITPFESDGEFECPPAESLEQLDAQFDERLAAQNSFVAIRADVKLAEITLRSVPRQEPPYRPLAEVTKGQTVWTHQAVAGTLLAMRCPAWVEGVNVPGYHWHFLSDDRKIAGHVIDCRVQSGTVSFDRCGSWYVQLDAVAGDSLNLGQDLSRELDQVERLRKPN